MLQKNYLVLGGILLIAVIVRFLWLDRIPHSVNLDQLYYLLNAKSFFLTGKDISQTISPFQVLLFTPMPHELVQAELLHFLVMPFIGPFSFSLLGALFPNAILGVLIVLLLYLITKKLIGEQAALFTSFIAAVNPWFITIGRTSYEMIPATFFYLCSLYVLFITKGWKIFFALPLFILAFYSYIGTKIILLPIALVSMIFCYCVIHKKQFAKQYLTLFLLLVAFVGFFFFQITHTGSPSRLSELAKPNSPGIAEQVDAMRKTSINSPIISLFENKYSVFTNSLISNMLLVFSPGYLFSHGDYFATLGQFGLFYPLELLFLIIGSGWLFIHKKKLFFYVWTMVLIAIVPEIIHYAQEKNNFTPHITLLFPFFMILMGSGMWVLSDFLVKKKQYIILCLIGCVYLFLIGRFMHLYFFHLPLQNGYYNFPDRILSRYISLSQSENKPIKIYTSNAKERFKSVIFYDDLYKKSTSADIAHAINTSKYTIVNIQFVGCDKKMKAINPDELVIIEKMCGMSVEGERVTVPLLADSGGVYDIFNDTTCQQYQIPHYVSRLTMNDLAIDHLPQQKFCETFIIRP